MLLIHLENCTLYSSVFNLAHAGARLQYSYIVCVCLSVTALAGAIKINVGIELKFLVQKL